MTRTFQTLIVRAIVIGGLVLWFGSQQHLYRWACGARYDDRPDDATPAAVKVSQALRHHREASHDDWIEHGFKAADPAEQEWCVQVLKQGTSSDGTGELSGGWKTKASPGQNGGAQFSQDIFIARNLFLDRAMEQEKGFYVEAGANHYKYMSSTFFFDKCLGWDGLCVEPQMQYHDDLRTKRSCTLVPKCLYKDEIQMMIGEGAGADVLPLPPPGTPLPQNMNAIACEPLHKILKEHADGRTHVDLFVLDVEGAEHVVLNSIDWDKLSFGALLIEDANHYGRTLDYGLNMKGYIKFHQLAIDSLYVRRESDVLSRKAPVWYPPNWSSFEQLCEMQNTCRADCPATGKTAVV